MHVKGSYCLEPKSDESIRRGEFTTKPIKIVNFHMDGEGVKVQIPVSEVATSEVSVVSRSISEEMYSSVVTFSMVGG